MSLQIIRIIKGLFLGSLFKFTKASAKKRSIAQCRGAT